jgi:shikimate kinase
LSHGHVPALECIVLVGFMAAGKSTVGRLLADRLGWDFVDFDDVIRFRTGRSAGALIREEGEPAFRRMEADLTRELAGRRRCVLAPGGGWATDPALGTALGEGTVRVWLRVSAREALRRARSGPDRPLLGAKDEAVEHLLRTRELLYAAAEVVVDVDDRDPEVVAEEILRRLGFEREDDER